VVDGIDDLGHDDAPEEDRRDVEIGVPELALDPDEWNALASRSDEH
jgi:hypothetical protein